MEGISTMIATVGFPIVACIALAYFCYTLVIKMIETMDNNTKALVELTQMVQADKEQQNEILAVINDLNKVINMTTRNFDYMDDDANV